MAKRGVTGGKETSKAISRSTPDLNYEQKSVVRHVTLRRSRRRSAMRASIGDSCHFPHGKCGGHSSADP